MVSASTQGTFAIVGRVAASTRPWLAAPMPILPRVLGSSQTLAFEIVLIEPGVNEGSGKIPAV